MFSTFKAYLDGVSLINFNSIGGLCHKSMQELNLNMQMLRRFVIYFYIKLVVIFESLIPGWRRWV